MKLGNNGTGKSTARSRRPRRGQHRRSALRRLADKGYHRAVWNRLGDVWHRVSGQVRRDKVGEQPTGDRNYYDLAGHRSGDEDPRAWRLQSPDLAGQFFALDYKLYCYYVRTTPLRRRLEILEMEKSA